MKKIVFLLLCLMTIAMLSGQTNPTAQSLPFTQDFSSVAHSSTTYPAGLQGWTISTVPGAAFNTSAPTANRVLVANSTAAINSGNVHNYNGKIGFLNTGSLDLSIVFAIDTQGKENVQVEYDVMTIRNPYDGGSNTRFNEVTLQYRVGITGAFTNLTGIEYQNNTTTQITAVTTPQNLSAKSIVLPAVCEDQAVVQLRLASRQVSGGGSRPSFAIDNIVIDGDDIVTETPTIAVSTSNLTGFSYELGYGPSSYQLFTISGGFLTDDITISAPADYEICELAGGTYVDTIVLEQSGGTVPETDIYVKLIAGLAIGTYNSETITASSADAEDRTVTCSGEVTAPPPPDAPEVIEGTDVTGDSFIATWDEVTDATSYRLDVYTIEQGIATELFFSEYIEGSSNNKAIEIFNGTGAAVDLSTYTVNLYSNGAVIPGNTVTLSGTLADGDVYVIANSAANAAILALADITSTVTFFNGDDALELVNSATKGIADIFGTIGEDPGAAWGTDPLITVEKTLVRKASVTGGVTTNPGSGFPALATEWDSYAQDSSAYLGSHSIDQIIYVPGYEDLTVTGTSQLVSGLEPNTTYYFVVRSVNEWGTSAGSEQEEITTEDEDLPVELSSFTAMISAENYVTLTWITQTETAMSGYYIYRADSSQLAEAQIVSPMIDATNTSQQQSYVFTDDELGADGTYYYWLQSVDMDGTGAYHGPISVYYTALGDGPTPEIPLATELKSVYPNPFNPQTFIPFSIANAANVSLKIYNSRGQIVKQIELGNKVPGNYRVEWNGTDSNGQILANGVYYIKMLAGKDSYQRKAVLLK